MAVKQPPMGPLQMPMGAQLTEVTLSPSTLCHYITDEQLAGLSEMHQDPVKDIFLASVGVFFGAIIPALTALAHFKDVKDPMTTTDLVSLVIAVAAVGIMAVTGFLWKRKAGGQASFLQTIRERPKVSVKLVS